MVANQLSVLNTKTYIQHEIVILKHKVIRFMLTWLGYTITLAN